MSLRKFLMLGAIFFCVACKAKSNVGATFSQSDSDDHLTDTILLKQNRALKNGKGKFEFVRFNNDFDYFFIEVKEANDLRSFIVNDFDDNKFLRGDSIEVEWKQDTIFIAGDGETPQLADWMVSIKKIKDGKVSMFRKEYQHPLRYLIYDTTKFSDSFKDRIYFLVEYYIANSNNQIIKLILKKKEPSLIYSIEESEREGRNYYMIGIAENFEDRFNYFQWLFIDEENYDLYEYDLPNDKLIPFE